LEKRFRVQHVILASLL